MSASITRFIPCTLSELRLDKTLVCGQSFRWREVTAGVWVGVLFGRIWKLWQTDSRLYFQVYGSGEITSKSTPVPKLETKEEQAFKQEMVENIDSKKSSKNHDKKHVKGRTSPESCGQSFVKDVSKSRKKSKLTRSTMKSENDHEIAKDFHSVVGNRSGSDKSVKLEKETYSDGLGALLYDYLQLKFNLSKLYQHWSKVDTNFEKVSSSFEGIRILRQDPVENLFSFICSSNNNISRISSMVEKLCENYGQEVGVVDGKTYFSFPSISSLCEEGVEEELRNLGFGYRAKYINKSAREIHEKYGESWLFGLREKSYTEAKSELMKLCGVGAKVADCVCLMSLDKLEAVPVDTHVWQIAARHYMPRLNQTKSLTDKLYVEIGDHFRSLWGEHAGWAHSVLFTADLRQFKNKEDSPSKKRKATKSEKSSGEESQTSPKSRKC